MTGLPVGAFSSLYLLMQGRQAGGGAFVIANASQKTIATQSQKRVGCPQSNMSTPSSHECLTLAGARCGERLRVVSLCPKCPDCVRLRELGFCESAEVRKVADGGAMICLLSGTRVAIGRALGALVRVERVAA